MVSEPALLPDDAVSVSRPQGGGAALYVNYFEIGHNPFEFLIELGQFRPGGKDEAGSVVIHTRIATTPSYAKMLSTLLNRAVVEHEAAHGEIVGLDEPATPFDIVLKSLPEFESRAARLRNHGKSAALSDPLQDR